MTQLSRREGFVAQIVLIVAMLGTNLVMRARGVDALTPRIIAVTAVGFVCAILLGVVRVIRSRRS